MNDYISRIMCIKFITFVLDLSVSAARYLKKRKILYGPSPPYSVHVDNVFHDPYLVEKIVRNISISDYFGMRVVSKTFNNACLSILRKDNRRMKIEFIQCIDDLSVTDTIVVHINLTPVKLSACAFYFNFLKKIAGLKVESIEVTDLDKLSSVPSFAHLAKKFHKTIHSRLIGNNHVKTLTGLENESSTTCFDCLKIANRCSVYGPINLSWMFTKFGKHFETIIITDVFLDQLANFCLLNTNSKENCYKMLDDWFSWNNISCTTLLLFVNEYRRAREIGGDGNHTPIPWEVLQIALTKWKVQKIELKFVYNRNVIPYMESWSASNYFTGIRFTDPARHAGFFKPLRKFSHIRVDLSRSIRCAGELKLREVATYGYENLIFNIKKLFKSDQITINFSHWLCKDSTKSQEVLENLLRITRIGFQRNLRINFKLFMNHQGITAISEEFEASGSLRALYHKALITKDKYFFGAKWIGKQYRFVDSEMNLTLHAEIYVNEY
ncbi:unnamed protein product [Caenorhabditis brenneri]